VDAGGLGGGAIFGTIGDQQAVASLPQLVMQIQFTPVPESATAGLVIIGGAFILLSKHVVR
jgi:hypothetical protein